MSAFTQGFFSGMNASSPTVSKQLDDLKKQWEASREKLKKKNEKHVELAKFTDTMGRSYIANLNVLVDVSHLLLEYRDFINVISKGLSDIDTEIGLGFKPEDLQYLKNLTTENIKKITQYFDRDYSNMEQVFRARGKPELVESLSGVKQNFTQVVSKIPQLGGRRPRVKPVKISRMTATRKRCAPKPRPKPAQPRKKQTVAPKKKQQPKK